MSTGRLSVSARMASGTLRYVHTLPTIHYRTNATDSPQKGMIIKWAILGSFFLFFMLWFFGGYIHAKRRLKAGKPLLKYHRVSPLPLPYHLHLSNMQFCSSS